AEEYVNEQGQTVQVYNVTEKTEIIPSGEITYYDNTLEPGEKVWGGSYTNGYSEYYYTRTVVDGVAGPDIGYDTYYVEPTYKTLTMGTKEHYKIVNVTTTTPIIAGKIVTEDPNKSASESYLVEG